MKVEDHSLKIANIGNGLIHNMEEVTLNLPGRDKKIEEYQQNLRNLGRAGIHTTVYAHMATGVTSSRRETTRGGASSRAFEVGKRVEEEIDCYIIADHWPKMVGGQKNRFCIHHRLHKSTS
ncbi:MAG: mannonate dehydratase [Bacteroidales bacterium]|nr:mannonate dehydratase [Bacteroidales bacterium]